MDRFPAEFEDMLTAAGRRVLTGTSPLCGALAEPRRRFLAERGLVSERSARAAVRLLDRTLYDLLEPLEQPIPPETMPLLPMSRKLPRKPPNRMSRGPDPKSGRNSPTRGRMLR